MNLAEIRQRVFDQMDFDPDLQQYRDSVVRRLNDHYFRISDSAHWLFQQKESTIQLRKDIDGSATLKITNNPSANNNFRYFFATGGMIFTSEMEGQTLIDTTNNIEHTIVRVYSSTQLYIKDNWTGPTGATSAFKIRFDRLKLPADCIEVLGYVDRADDRGRLLQIERKREEYAYLDRDNSGDAYVIIEDDAFFGLTPINKPVLTLGSSPGGGTSDLLDNTEYEYFYTIKAEGREGPPSQKVSITTGTSSQITISNIEKTQWWTAAGKTLTYHNSGISKFVYRRDKTNNGPIELIEILNASETSHTDDQLFYGVVGLDAELGTGANFQVTLSSPADRIIYNESGPRQYIRVHYTPSADKVLNIRYHYRPQKLIADHDSPKWPPQYHHLLVYAVLEDMFLQMQATDQAQVFRLRAEELLVQMRRRYLSRDEDRKRFQRFDTIKKYRNNFGPATTTFYGANGP